MKNFTAQFVTVLKARNEIAPSKDTATAISNAEKNTDALDRLFAKSTFDTVAKRLIADAEIPAQKLNKEKFIAVKVLVKIVSTACAIQKQLTSELDPYTKTILENLVTLQQVSNKSALVSLSKSIEYDETEAQAQLTKRYNCNPTTASTQASSTRMTLKLLDVCEVQKGKRGDIIKIKDNPRTKMLLSLFAEVESNDEEHEEVNA